MRKKCVIKRVLAGIMVFATVALAGKTSALVDGNAAVAEAEQRLRAGTLSDRIRKPVKI